MSDFPWLSLLCAAAVHLIGAISAVATGNWTALIWVIAASIWLTSLAAALYVIAQVTES